MDQGAAGRIPLSEAHRREHREARPQPLPGVAQERDDRRQWRARDRAVVVADAAPRRPDPRTSGVGVIELSPAAQQTLDELAAIVEPDGARLVVRDASASTITIELDLSKSECPECVLPRDLLVDILASRLQESDPDLRTVDLIDPREADASH